MFLAAVMPQLAPMFDFDQKNPHHYLDVWAHTVQALSSSVPVPAVRLALLFHDSGKPASFTTDEKGIGHFYGHPAKSEEIAREIMQQLRFDHATADRVRLLVRWHDADILPEGRSVKRWLNRLGEEGLRQLLQVKAADRVRPIINLRICRCSGWWSKNWIRYCRKGSVFPGKAGSQRKGPAGAWVSPGKTARGSAGRPAEPGDRRAAAESAYSLIKPRRGDAGR